jgi:iron complex outermembrane receptor protein
LGKDANNNPLPLIAPISWTSALEYNSKQVYSQLKMQAATKQYQYGAEYGEKQAPAYIIFGASLGYEYPLRKMTANLKIGVENILDTKYTTYSDWNHILQKGRNFYINFMVNF